MGLKHQLRTLRWKTGYDVTRFQPTCPPIAKRNRFFEIYAIDTVLDVGANTGQFASELRNDMGYGGNIFSFEPLSTAYKTLETRARNDPRWQTIHHARGDKDETREINVAANSESSSLLAMLPSHLKSAPQSESIGKETIRIRTLDGVFPALCPDARSIYLKKDTQGFEKNVPLGARESLARIDTVQMELSLVPLHSH